MIIDLINFFIYQNNNKMLSRDMQIYFISL